jgi:hypothetical protein
MAPTCSDRSGGRIRIRNVGNIRCSSMSLLPSCRNFFLSLSQTSRLSFTSLSLNRDLYQPAHFEGLAAALQAPSLHNLTQFSLEMRVYSESLLDPVLMPVFAAVTTLPCLLHLQSDLPFAIVWVELLGHCVFIFKAFNGRYPGNLQKLFHMSPPWLSGKPSSIFRPFNISTD